MKKLTAVLALILLAMLFAGVFGSVHDQVSFTVSSEYFTKFKFIQFGLRDPAIPERVRVAIVGFLASWYVGIPIGLVVARLAFAYPSPREMLLFGLRSFGTIIGLTALFALGGLAYGCFQTRAINLNDYADWFIPKGIVHIRRYLCAGYMHNAAYLGGICVTIGFATFHYVIGKFKN